MHSNDFKIANHTVNYKESIYAMVGQLSRIPFSLNTSAHHCCLFLPLLSFRPQPHIAGWVNSLPGRDSDTIVPLLLSILSYTSLTLFTLINFSMQEAGCNSQAALGTVSCCQTHWLYWSLKSTVSIYTSYSSIYSFICYVNHSLIWRQSFKVKTQRIQKNLQDFKFDL